MTRGLLSSTAFQRNKNILQGTTTISLGDFNFFHGQDRKQVRKDIIRLKALLKINDNPVVLAQQVHGKEIGVVRKRPRTQISYIPRTDALVTDLPGILLGILTADCVPVFLYDREKRVIGAIHAGWRGVAKGIVPDTVRKMRSSFRCRPEDITAAIGPHICRSHYEVDMATAHELGLRARGKIKVDLGRLIRQQLLAAGVKGAYIAATGLCTYGSLRLYSFRHQREMAGRMLSFLLIK